MKFPFLVFNSDDPKEVLGFWTGTVFFDGARPYFELAVESGDMFNSVVFKWIEYRIPNKDPRGKPFQQLALRVRPEDWALLQHQYPDNIIHWPEGISL